MLYAGILICIFKIFYEFLKDAQSSQRSHGDKSMMDLSLSAVRVSRNIDFFYQSSHNKKLYSMIQLFRNRINGHGRPMQDGKL